MVLQLSSKSLTQEFRVDGSLKVLRSLFGAPTQEHRQSTAVFRHPRKASRNNVLNLSSTGRQNLDVHCMPAKQSAITMIATCDKEVADVEKVRTLRARSTTMTVPSSACPVGKSSNNHNDVSGSAESFNDAHGSVLSSQYRRLSSMQSFPQMSHMYSDSMYPDLRKVAFFDPVPS